MNNERVSEIMHQIANLASEAASLLNTEEPTQWDRITKEEAVRTVLADYITDQKQSTKLYELSGWGEITPLRQAPVEVDPTLKKNTFTSYLTSGLAEQAEKMKFFNDILLAYKYCYDCAYQPTWVSYSSDNDTIYTVVYDNVDGEYIYDMSSSLQANLVCFSSLEVASNCARFLNQIDPEGKLIY